MDLKEQITKEFAGKVRTYLEGGDNTIDIVYLIERNVILKFCKKQIKKAVLETVLTKNYYKKEYKTTKEYNAYIDALTDLDENMQKVFKKRGIEWDCALAIAKNK